MGKEEICDMFSHLHPSVLDRSGAYTVYNVHDDNVIRARVFNLKRGTPVFVDENGQAILKISCGNPMVAPTPKPVIIVKTVRGPIREHTIIKEVTRPDTPTSVVQPAPPA